MRHGVLCQRFWFGKDAGLPREGRVPSALTIRPSKIARREISVMAPVIVHRLPEQNA